MKKEIITRDTIVLNAEFADKWAAIAACGTILHTQGYVAEAYIADMAERERTATVYVGNHVAIPHGIANSEENIWASGIAFVQVPNGVSFGEEKAYVLIGIAGKNGAHIEMLGKIAEVCMDLDNVELLRTTTNKEEVLRLLNGNFDM